MAKKRDRSVLFGRYRRLKQYKDLTDEQINAMLDERFPAAVDDVAVKTLFVDAVEKRLANELLKKYTREYSIESVSDKNTLMHLIYLEVLNKRQQDILNKFHTESKSAPLPLIDSIHKNLNMILQLKNSLGLLKDKKQAEQSDGYKAFETLKKKFKIWQSENQGSRTMICPHCSKMVLLKIRTEAWESQKHPFFKDRILGNEALVKLYREKKLTKEEVASILEVSPDYVVWLIDKWDNKKSSPAEGVSEPPSQDITPVQESSSPELKGVSLDTEEVIKQTNKGDVNEESNT